MEPTQNPLDPNPHPVSPAIQALRDRNQVTMQNTFNRVWAYSQTMTHQSKQKDTDLPAWQQVCQYRAPDGNKCFFGNEIPDSIYQPNMENQNINQLLDNYPELKQHFLAEGLNTQNILFNSSLQNIHDNYFDSRKYYLRNLAAEYGLTLGEGGEVPQKVE